MTIGTDTLATLTFPGSNGAAVPSEWTAFNGTWSQNGASGVTHATGSTLLKVLHTDPARANENLSLSMAGYSNGSGITGVFLRWVAGTGTNSTGYFIAVAGTVQLFKYANGVAGSVLASCVPTAVVAWMSGATFSVDTQGNGDVIISASSTGGGGQSFTYTDVAANTPYLTGKPGVASTSNSTAAVFTGPIVIKGTAATSPLPVFIGSANTSSSSSLSARG